LRCSAPLSVQVIELDGSDGEKQAELVVLIAEEGVASTSSFGRELRGEKAQSLRASQASPAAVNPSGDE